MIMKAVCIEFTFEMNLRNARIFVNGNCNPSRLSDKVVRAELMVPLNGGNGKDRSGNWISNLMHGHKCLVEIIGQSGSCSYLSTTDDSTFGNSCFNFYKFFSRTVIFMLLQEGVFWSSNRKMSGPICDLLSVGLGVMKPLTNVVKPRFFSAAQ